MLLLWVVEVGEISGSSDLIDLPRSLVDGGGEAAATGLFAFLEERLLLLLQPLHLLGVGPVEVVQVELLPGAVQLLLRQLPLLGALLRRQLGLPLQLAALQLLAARLDQQLVSFIGEDRSFLLVANDLTTFLVDLRFECRLCPGGSLSSAAFLAFRGRRRCKRSHMKLSCRRC